MTDSTTTPAALSGKAAFPYHADLFASDQEFAKIIAALKPSVQTKAAKVDTTDNRTRTENGDGAFKSTKNALVDLFFELNDNFDAEHMEKILTAAWEYDPLATLKIIFNARSIHLGKATRPGAYRALGWLYQTHPQTFIANLAWLVRPVIDQTPVNDAKPAEDETQKDTPACHLSEDFEVVDAPEEADSVVVNPATLGAFTAAYDINNGAAHGYWKDLPNILALAVNGEFHLGGDIRSVFNIDVKAEKPRLRNWDATQAKEDKKVKKVGRFLRATKLFNNDPNYRALHLTIARLFASQLQADTEIRTSGKNLKSISLAAKWAPSSDEFHDKHTFIVGSIAELMHPREVICAQVEKDDRAQYLMYARMAYRKLTVSPLRKLLEVVERDITAGSFENIKYEHVPSLAMEKYQGTFINKDTDRFSGYLDKVTSGNAKISGAILLPSQMVCKALKRRGPSSGKNKSTVEKLAEERVLEGQWKSMVNRIKESGTIQGAIAVCDVSGSMTHPQFRDGTCPMDSAIGLSLLLAEVVDGPFGGHFITFHSTPEMHKAGGPSDIRSFREKVSAVAGSDWGMNTDFVAVFEKLILRHAKNNEIKPEDMVKQVFVFSDMQFDAAGGQSYYSQENLPQWSSSFERIKKLYEDAGYNMPTLVFWNLAGGRTYAYGSDEDDGPGKPVTAEQPGTALVSGYSQGQLKMFLDGGSFQDVEEEEVVEDSNMKDADEEMVNIRVTKKQKVDPLITVERAISHAAYSMLKVVD